MVFYEVVIILYMYRYYSLSSEKKTRLKLVVNS
jgi:hypothetical protein